MSDFNLSDYIENINFEDLDREKLQNAFDRVIALVKERFPDLDVASNSVFGNLIAEPLAFIIVNLEEASRRMFSDLQLANVAAGEIYNCDFVKEYLKNFGLTPDNAVPVYGVVRLNFNSDQNYTIDRGTTLLVDGGESIFYFIAPKQGHIQIGETTSSPQSGNWYQLSQFDENTWYVDIPVVGPEGSEVDLNTEFLIDVEIEELDSVVAITDFDNGLLPEDVPTLAKLAQKRFYSATLATRGGAVSFVHRQFPNVLATSPVQSGDVEMQRDKSNILGISDGRVDLHIRSVLDLPEGLIQPDLDFTGSTYEGELSFQHIPSFITRVVERGTDTPVTYSLIGESTDNDRARDASAGFTEFEKFEIIISSSDPDLKFDVFYLFDPTVKVLSEIVKTPETDPVIDSVVKPFHTCFVDEIKVKYRRKVGKRVDKTLATEEIFKYINSLGYPELYEESAITDIMLYAGAIGVKDIEVTAEIYSTLADQYELENGATVSVNSKSTNDLRDDDLDNGSIFSYTGNRNIGFILPMSNIVLEEVVL